MDTASLPPLASALARPTQVDTYASLASGWHDMRACLRFEGAAPALQAVPGFGNHFRRSLFGALAAGASVEARSGLPCLWDPPCTLDVFGREQLRNDDGDGVPKPFALHLRTDQGDLIVELTVFGMACDWFHAVAEALAIGALSVLPWEKASLTRVKSPPRLTQRLTSGVSGIAAHPAPGSVRLRIETGLDRFKSGDATPEKMLAAALRRVDAVSRWQGLSIDPDTGRHMTTLLKQMRIDETALTPAVIEMPNRHSTRKFHVFQGELVLHDPPEDLLPALMITERCHIGRGSVWGLGRISLE